MRTPRRCVDRGDERDVDVNATPPRRALGATIRPFDGLFAAFNDRRHTDLAFFVQPRRHDTLRAASNERRATKRRSSLKRIDASLAFALERAAEQRATAARSAGVGCQPAVAALAPILSELHSSGVGANWRAPQFAAAAAAIVVDRLTIAAIAAAC